MSGLHGGLELIASLDARGRTTLRKQTFSPPIHISKPHTDGRWLVVNLASPSPGLLEGDRVQASVSVEPGAHLLLTAPSANRIHATPTGHAELRQDFTVEMDGFLDVWPAYLIPQAGARYHQRTKLRVARGGTLLWTETMAPGRVARGEVFAFAEVKLATDLFSAEQQIVRERYRLTPESVAALRQHFSTAYYASILCVSPKLANASAALGTLTETHSNVESWVGCTRVSEEAWAIKVIAADSPRLRTTVGQIRATIFEVLGCPPANLRRTTGESV